MATIVRVKRRRTDDPVDSLLLSCKKAKNQIDTTAPLTEDESQDILKFAGTLSTKDDCVSRPVREAIKKDKLQKEYKRHICDVAENVRQQIKQTSADNRYKITSKHRTLEIEKLDKVSVSDSCCGDVQKDIGQEEKPIDSEHAFEVEGGKVFRLFDVEKECVGKSRSKSHEPAHNAACEITCNSVPMVQEACQTDGDYVYDLYYTNNQDFNFRLLEDMLKVEAYNEDFCDDRVLSDEELYDGSDDSNDENNWRNDYPDEEPNFFENDAADQDFDIYNNDMTFGIDGPLSEYMSSRCNIEDKEDENDVSSEEEELAYFGQPFDPTCLGQVSYESYIKQVKKEFQEFKNEENKDNVDG